MSDLYFGILTISDTCHKDASKDKSGPRLIELIKAKINQNARITADILPDEQVLIEQELRTLIASKFSVIITTGGTGFAPRDVTPEATKQVIERECPQLSMLLTLDSLQKTKFAALSRGVCGIAGQTLILNFPGSEKAVIECFASIRDILPHALALIKNELPLVREIHAQVQGDTTSNNTPTHICPHKTGLNDGIDRNSPFPMIPFEQALYLIFENIVPTSTYLQNEISPINIPAFRASIKDGYAMKSSSFSGVKRVVGFISAGDDVNTYRLQDDECFKINTGAALPLHADCVVQIEDTKLLQSNKNGEEELVEICCEPTANLDIRKVGCDMRHGEHLFPTMDNSSVVQKSILASVGKQLNADKPKIAIISTGSELLAPGTPITPGKIYDSNTTMLQELLNYFGFECITKMVLNDR